MFIRKLFIFSLFLIFFVRSIIISNDRELRRYRQQQRKLSGGLNGTNQKKSETILNVERTQTKTVSKLTADQILEQKQTNKVPSQKLSDEKINKVQSQKSIKVIEEKLSGEKQSNQKSNKIIEEKLSDKKLSSNQKSNKVIEEKLSGEKLSNQKSNKVQSQQSIKVIEQQLSEEKLSQEKLTDEKLSNQKSDQKKQKDQEIVDDNGELEMTSPQHYEFYQNIYQKLINEIQNYYGFENIEDFMKNNKIQFMKSFYKDKKFEETFENEINYQKFLQDEENLFNKEKQIKNNILKIFVNDNNVSDLEIKFYPFNIPDGKAKKNKQVKIGVILSTPQLKQVLKIPSSLGNAEALFNFINNHIKKFLQRNKFFIHEMSEVSEHLFTITKNKFLDDKIEFEKLKELNDEDDQIEIDYSNSKQKYDELSSKYQEGLDIKIPYQLFKKSEKINTSKIEQVFERNIENLIVGKNFDVFYLFPEIEQFPKIQIYFLIEEAELQIKIVSSYFSLQSHVTVSTFNQVLNTFNTMLKQIEQNIMKFEIILHLDNQNHSLALSRFQLYSQIFKDQKFEQMKFIQQDDVQIKEDESVLHESDEDISQANLFEERKLITSQLSNDLHNGDLFNNSDMSQKKISNIKQENLKSKISVQSNSQKQNNVKITGQLNSELKQTVKITEQSKIKQENLKSKISVQSNSHKKTSVKITEQSKIKQENLKSKISVQSNSQKQNNVKITGQSISHKKTSVKITEQSKINQENLKSKITVQSNSQKQNNVKITRQSNSDLKQTVQITVQSNQQKQNNVKITGQSNSQSKQSNSQLKQNKIKIESKLNTEQLNNSKNTQKLKKLTKDKIINDSKQQLEIKNICNIILIGQQENQIYKTTIEQQNEKSDKYIDIKGFALQSMFYQDTMILSYYQDIKNNLIDICEKRINYNEFDLGITYYENQQIQKNTIIQIKEIDLKQNKGNDFSEWEQMIFKKEEINEQQNHIILLSNDKQGEELMEIFQKKIQN